MSETRAEYLSNQKTPVTCRECGVILGHEVQIAGGCFVMAVGPLLLRSVDGVCLMCNTSFSWHANDKKLAVLLDHLLKLNQ